MWCSFIPPGGAVKLQPSGLLLQYSPGFVSFVHQGGAGAVGMGISKRLSWERHDSFKGFQVFPEQQEG